jgi:4-hydroxy-tetrahydrodipicolinate reductase
MLYLFLTFIIRERYGGGMNLIISGYGKMGSLIEQRAYEDGSTIVAVCAPEASGVSKCGAPVFKRAEEIPQTLFDRAVFIDFTHPSAVFGNIKTALQRKAAVIVGTTGWYERLDEVKNIVNDNGAALLYSANFSLGVNLFYKIAGYAAALIDRFDEYDAGGFEAHHNRKADSPSGTAKIIGEIILKNMRRKNKVVYDKLDRPPEKDELHFASVRAGYTPGTHTVYFDSSADTIEITHTARNREGLVSGTIAAARWLDENYARGRRGVFTLEDVLEC